MKAEYVNARRAAILALHARQTPPQDIALELGCALATVYKVLADPTPDKRGARETSTPRIHPRHVENVKRLASVDPTLTPAELYSVLADNHNPARDPPLPSLPSVGRHLRRLRQSGAVPPSPPEANPFPDAEDVAVVDAYDQLPDDAASLRTELAVLRSLLKQSLRESLLPTLSHRARQRLREHSALLIRDIGRTLRTDAAIRPKPVGDEFTFRHLDRFAQYLVNNDVEFDDPISTVVESET